MPDIYVDVDTAVIVPVNIFPLIDDTDFKTIETAVVYNSAGMALTWNFVTSAGVVTQTAVTPTTGGVYDWSEPLADKGMYAIGIPASGGASINNDTEGYGWFTGVCTGVLPWRSPIIGFRAAALNNALCDGGDVLDVSVTEIGGVAQSATDLKHFADSGYDPATTKVQGVVLVDTTTTNTDMRGTNSAALASVCTEARLAELDGANLPTDVAAVKTDTAAILLDTGTDGVVVAPVHRPANASGTAQSGTISQITLEVGASSIDNIYRGQKISIYEGTGNGQTRGISSYNGTTKVVAVARNWELAPDGTSKYRIEYDFGPKVNNNLQVFVNDDGADLSAIPWNAAWDTEVQSECADALTAYAPATPADVLTQVDAALDTAGTELSAIPTTTGTIRQKLNFLFQYFRNKKTITSTTETLKKEDASTTLGTSTVSDDGSVFTKGEMS